MKGIQKHIRHLQAKRSSKWALYIIVLWMLIALFSNLVANEKPLFIRIDGQNSWPVFEAIIAEWTGNTYQFDTRQIEQADQFLLPIIPYSYHTIDPQNANFVSPFGDQDIHGQRYRHWLGTDQLGRDVLAGLIHGARISAIVGIMTMMIAGLIGLFLGLVSGFFGNRKLGMPRGLMAALIIFCLALIYILYYKARHTRMLSESNSYMWWLSGMFVFFALLIFGLSHRFKGKSISFPADTLIIKSIEIFRSVPNLFILLALLPLFKRPSINQIFLILGFISWPTMALLIRSETMRIRERSFIKSSSVLGLRNSQIIIYHILPNVLGPFWVSMAFGISSAIIAESTLSFLGIGVPLDQVTWGSMLNEARIHFKAWWLALFPGIALFLLVLSFNVIWR